MWAGYIQPDTVGNIISGTVGSGDLAAGVVFSGNIASGQVSQFHLSSGAVNSGHIGNAAVVSGSVASGQLFTLHVASGGFLSGAIGSGQIARFHLASGQVFSGAGASGFIDNLLWNSEQIATVETVSGFKAVCVTSGGVLALAMAGSGLRLPALGVVALNLVSGAVATLLRGGKITPTSGLDFRWSGKAGQLLYVGSGGEVVSQALLVSGQSWQRLGTAYSGGLYIGISPVVTSGGIAGPAGTF